MNMELKKTWTDLKSLLAKKEGRLQYIDKESQYKVWFNDGEDTYFARIEKTDPAGTDQEDFEDNYKEDCNQEVIPKTTDGVQYVRRTDKTIGLVMRIHGGEFTAVADTTTKHQLKFTSDVEIVGMICKVNGAHAGDKIQVKCIDVDNILGYGAGTVLAQFAIDVPAELCEEHIQAESTTSDLIMEGLYMSLEYENTHASEDAQVQYVYKYYR